MQAAKLANIEPVRLVSSCLAASVYARYHRLHWNVDNVSCIESRNGSETNESEYNITNVTSQGVINNRSDDNDSNKNERKSNDSNSHKLHENDRRLVKDKITLIMDISYEELSMSVIEETRKLKADIVRGTVDFLSLSFSFFFCV